MKAINIVWYHGSTQELSVLGEGGVITRWQRLAEATSIKPEPFSRDAKSGRLEYRGVSPGYLYMVDEEVDMQQDIAKWDASALEQGVEWLAKRPLKLKLVRRTQPRDVYGFIGAYLHDYTIHSYTVDIEDKSIVLRTSYSEKERADVVFEGVLTHRFEDVMHQNVINDFSEENVESFLKWHENEPHKWKCNAYPVLFDDKDDLQSWLEDRGYRIFDIVSSIGLSGFVIAKSLRLLVEPYTPV